MHVAMKHRRFCWQKFSKGVFHLKAGEEKAINRGADELRNLFPDAVLAAGRMPILVARQLLQRQLRFAGQQVGANLAETLLFVATAEVFDRLLLPAQLFGSSQIVPGGAALAAGEPLFSAAHDVCCHLGS